MGKLGFIRLVRGRFSGCPMHGEKRPIHGEYLRFRKKGFFGNINPQIESLLYKKILILL